MPYQTHPTPNQSLSIQTRTAHSRNRLAMEILKLIENFCKATASQEEKFRNCPLARESEIFPDSYSNQFSLSPDFIPSETTGIIVLSLPNTPPEQNPNDLCAEQLTVAEASEAAKLRVPVAGLEDEPEAKGFEVEPGEETGGDTEEAEIKGGQIIDSPNSDAAGGDTEGAEIKGGKIIDSPNSDAAGGDRGETPKNAKKRKHSGIETSKNAEKSRKLPPSFEGREKEKEVEESSEQKSGLFEVLDIVKVLLGYNDGGGDSADVNVVETAKMMGLEFPIPRWWPSEDDDPQRLWY